MNPAIIGRVATIVGWLFIGLGVAGLLLGLSVLAVTGLSDSGTDDPTTYVVLVIVATTQLALGAAVLRVFGTTPPDQSS